MRSTILSLALAAHAATAYSMKSYDISLSDPSPMLVYDPPVGNPLTGRKLDANAWNVSYTQTPWTEYQQYKIGYGPSYHWAPTGATMKLTWMGTGVKISGLSGLQGYGRDFYGEAELDVDGQAGTCNGPAAVIECSASNLTAGKHTATLTVKSGTITVAKVIAQSNLETDLDPTDAPVEKWMTYDNGAINPDIKADGWTPINTWQDTIGADKDYPRIFCNVTNAYAEVTTPPKTSIVEIWGAVDSDHGNFVVDIRPTPPNGVDSWTATAFNPWATRDQLLFFTSLDPNTQYTVRYTHLETGGDKFSDISEFRFIKSGSESKSSSSGISAGAIAGIVVGVVVGLLIIALLVWFFCIRRKRSEATTSRPFRGTIDGEGEPVYGPQPTPLALPTPASGGTSNEPLLSMRNRQAFSSVSGYTSSSGDPYLDAETNSTTTAGYAGLGTGGGDSLLPPIPLTKAQMARQNANGGRGPTRHVYQQHADAGSVIHNPDEDTVVEEVPPSYNPEWASSGGGPSEAGYAESALSSPRPLGSPRTFGGDRP